MYRPSTVNPRRRRHLRRGMAIAALAACVGGVAACGSSTESGDVGSPDDAPVVTEAGSGAAGEPSTDDAAGDAPAGDTPVADDPIAAAPALVPSATFAVADADQLSSLAMSPDGTQVAVVTQPGLGEALTIRLYDAATGEVTNTTEAEAIGLSLVQWMADGRLVAYADREAEPMWRSWDAATLEELPSVPLDFSCYTGRADRTTGVVYASDGLTSMGDDLCRVDTSDGSITRSGAGVLTDPSQYWLVQGSGSVVVTHYPDADGPKELVTLDGVSLEPQSAVAVGEGDSIQAVGVTTWLSPFDGPDRLEPGAIPVPPRLSPEASDGGTVFISSNGMDDFVFVSAVDGSVIGTMPAGLNPGNASDWSLDDSTFVRLTLDGEAEIYQF